MVTANDGCLAGAYATETTLPCGGYGQRGVGTGREASSPVEYTEGGTRGEGGRARKEIGKGA